MSSKVIPICLCAILIAVKFSLAQAPQIQSRPVPKIYEPNTTTNVIPYAAITDELNNPLTDENGNILTYE